MNYNFENLEVEYIPTNQLKPYKGNAKKHPDEQVAQIVASIEQFGFNDPIAIDEDGTIIEGHGRLLAANILKMETVPVIRLEHLDEEAKRAYILAHNKLTMNSGFDFDVLRDELSQITDIDMGDFGFGDFDHFWGDDELKDSDEYNEFTEKFEQKKTTDDCYTPDTIYDVVASYVSERYHKDRKDFVRPFYPNGDYKKEHYKAGAVVVDNPPFSILAEIVDFYTAKGIPFFLFAPGLSSFNYINRKNVAAVCVYAPVTYENGANVQTSFLTNLEPDDVVAMSAPELSKKLKEANEENLRAIHKQLPSYEYPDHILTAAKLGYISAYGQELTILRNVSQIIREMDAQKELGKGIYGSALILSNKAAAEKAAAEKAAAEKAAAEKRDAHVWELSDREREIIRKLSENDEN